MKQIHTDKAPAAIGPYSQAIEAGGLIFCSGQIGLDPKTGNLVEGLEKQTLQTLRNLQAVLEEAGSDKKNIIKTSVFLKNVEDFKKMNAIYETFFENRKPARSTVEVSNLPGDALIEIDVIAIKEKDENCGGNCQC